MNRPTLTFVEAGRPFCASLYPEICNEWRSAVSKTKAALSMCLAAALTAASLATPAIAGVPRSGPVINAPPMAVWCRAQLATANHYLEQYLATGDDSYYALYAEAFAAYNLNCNY
ncbi:hypothetical protein GCM10009422_20150 [Brevundimonas kwangchunensis]|uniref:Uncharacterized protein n=1 Tax=Brevundimonas kwangchunensis TaxID=322163 RepID=A0ABN1GYU6_9CAUL